MDWFNERATQQLKELLKGIPNIEFTDEKPTGFYLTTPLGRFWFECECDSITDDNFVTYRGNNYLVRKIQLSEGETVLIGTETLEQALIDPVTSQYTDDEAQAIDEKIYFYVPDDHITDSEANLVSYVEKETGITKEAVNQH